MMVTTEWDGTSWPVGSQLVDGEYGEKRNPNSFQLDFATIHSITILE
jgi:hypothetical protein